MSKMLSATPFVPTTDFEQSIPFYETLGFITLHSDPIKNIMRCDEVLIILWKNGEEVVVDGHTQLMIATNELAELSELIQETLASYIFSTKENEYSNRSISVKDPAGNIITFYENAPMED